ncbi:IclR family transcriptional regulator [Solihabitans fulvus]|uniref:IclR family transcriptional regulator n=1 Tax=Solihabitans fulvus TaxID=1892852 RepID=A0A5B2XWE7_9PSEU|nr:IclR family transcriptional regulator [Solihabitans fulvus]KAA2267014.1 IclR family transcriptional regulator [Solihabitans fulvus]
MSTEPTVVKSADRVLAVFDLLAERGPLSFSDICEALELPKSSTHNLLHTMVIRGYLDRDPQQKAFRLGVRVWQVAQHCTDVEHLRRLLRPLMERLVERTEETVQLATLDGVSAVYLEIVESPHPMKLTSKVGSRLPAHASAVGKVLLAHLPAGEAGARLAGADLVRMTDRTLTTVDALLRDLALTRQRGYGLDMEEFVIGCRCVAMPVRNADGTVIAALSVSIPTPRYSRETAAAARAELAATVAEAERLIG